MGNEFNKIKKFLPVGYSKRLAKEFNVSEGTVIGALRNKNRRFDIIQRAIELARENIKIIDELSAVASEIKSENGETV